MRHRTDRRPAAFTLVELLAVLIIIGILMAFILVAAMAGLRRAEERATQGLIMKLDAALTDRVEALLATNVDPNQVHQFISSIYVGSLTQTGYITSSDHQERAEVIARVDQMKYELPDVFMLQVDPSSISSGGAGVYPLNFAMLPWTDPAGNYTSPYVPLGTLPPAYLANNFPNTPRSDKGIWGASYAAAAGIYKNLGYAPIGYDGQDNDGDGNIDDLNEGSNYGNATFLNAIGQHLANHTHKTARSEMLYALLVEGQGFLGSQLSRDDFTDREVRDTDGDGLPEFVDAWGEPLQFYRWPIYYTSDLQKGYQPYNGPVEYRQQNPIDPNQDLVAPGWWSDWANGNNQAPSIQVYQYFQPFFFILVDPQYHAPGSNLQLAWDRSQYYYRRAYFSRPLIVSSGPDKNLGLGQLAHDYGPDSGGPTPTQIGANASNPSQLDWTNVTNVVPMLLWIENQAAACNPQPNVGRAGTYYQVPDALLGANASATTLFIQDAGGDDISNQNLQANGGGIQ